MFLVTRCHHDNVTFASLFMSNYSVRRTVPKKRFYRLFLLNTDESSYITDKLVLDIMASFVNEITEEIQNVGENKR